MRGKARSMARLAGSGYASFGIASANENHASRKRSVVMRWTPEGHCSDQHTARPASHNWICRRAPSLANPRAVGGLGSRPALVLAAVPGGVAFLVMAVVRGLKVTHCRITVIDVW